MFKYYLGAYNMFDAAQKPLISGRISLSLLSPEPGYYGSSTYLGKDLLGIGVGGQYQKNGDQPDPPTSEQPRADYGMVLADLLFEKDFKAAGVLDIEGAFYKYVGDDQAMDISYMAMASYLISKFQPLVRVQQAMFKDGRRGGNTVTMIDGQVALLPRWLFDENGAGRLALGEWRDEGAGESLGQLGLRGPSAAEVVEIAQARVAESPERVRRSGSPHPPQISSLFAPVPLA